MSCPIDYRPHGLSALCHPQAQPSLDRPGNSLRRPRRTLHPCPAHWNQEARLYPQVHVIQTWLAPTVCHPWLFALQGLDVATRPPSMGSPICPLALGMSLVDMQRPTRPGLLLFPRSTVPGSQEQLCLSPAQVLGGHPAHCWCCLSPAALLIPLTRQETGGVLWATGGS